MGISGYCIVHNNMIVSQSVQYIHSGTDGRDEMRSWVVTGQLLLGVLLDRLIAAREDRRSNGSGI